MFGMKYAAGKITWNTNSSVLLYTIEQPVRGAIKGEFVM